ncbi:MAG: hypothetical protein ACKO5F_00205 [Synechococcus sp.]
MTPALQRILRLTTAALTSLALTPDAQAAPFNQATLRRIVEGRDVFIDRQPARVNQTAGSGQQVSTGNSRAELLFDRQALGYLGKNSLITLGQSCFRLQNGTVLVNGPQTGCIGSRVLGVRGTTYVLTALTDGTYELAVLHGEALVGVAPEANPDSTSAAEANPDILSLYPRLNPVIDLGSSAFGSNAGGVNLGAAEGLVLGELGLFLPLVQSEGSKVLYSYSRTNTNFDGFWGISSELGYRWFDPNNQSLNGALLGYDGWQGNGCFHSQVAVGAEWERNRWQLTALGGIPVDGCNDSLGYATAGVGIPVINLGQQSILLGLSPYMLTTSGDAYAGGRISIDVPLGNQVDLMAYGQYDDLLETTVGGQVRIRFAIGGGFVADPNLRQAVQSPLPWQSRQRGQQQGGAALIAQAASTPFPAEAVHWTGHALAQDNPANQQTALIQAGEMARLDGEGNVISKTPLSRDQFEALISANLKGQKLLPESHAIGKLYEQLYRPPIPSVLAITGLDWYLRARDPMPRLRGANNLVVPESKLKPSPEPSPSPSPEQSPSPSPEPSP